MKRVAITRGTVWKRPRPIVRPGVTPKMPRGWVKLSRRIKARDNETCRYCGQAAPIGVANHIIPRRLYSSGAEASYEANLAWMHPGCHSGAATYGAERWLYDGNVLYFASFVQVLARSGPVPDAEQLGAAYLKVKEMLYGVAIPG